VVAELPAKVLPRLFCLPSKTLPAKLFAGCFPFPDSFPAAWALFLPAVLFLYQQFN
jgi:hypothetical protein